MVSRGFDPTARGDQSRGGGSTHILKLYWDVPPLRVWFFDRPLIKRVSIFQDFHKFFIIYWVRVSRSERQPLPKLNFHYHALITTSSASYLSCKSIK